MTCRLLPILLILPLTALPAAAQQVDSAYTGIDLDACSVIKSDDFGSTWACPGYKGIPLMIAEGDLRFFVSYGFGAPEERAAEQTLPPFNTLGPTLEWRLSNAEGGWKPFATIVSYLTDQPEGEGSNEVLVVTRLAAGATCHIAYVDALSNDDANELARKAADELAADFDCTNEPEIVGAFKAW